MGTSKNLVFGSTHSTIKHIPVKLLLLCFQWKIEDSIQYNGNKHC
jgi:hypothetical protein